MEGFGKGPKNLSLLLNLLTFLYIYKDLKRVPPGFSMKTSVNSEKTQRVVEGAEHALVKRKDFSQPLEEALAST